MKIRKFGEKRVYTVDERNGEWLLIKVINKYDNKQQAYSDMVDLLHRKKTEEELLEEFKRKDK